MDYIAVASSCVVLVLILILITLTMVILSLYKIRIKYIAKKALNMEAEYLVHTGITSKLGTLDM